MGRVRKGHLVPQAMPTRRLGEQYVCTKVAKTDQRRRLIDAQKCRERLTLERTYGLTQTPSLAAMRVVLTPSLSALLDAANTERLIIPEAAKRLKLNQPKWR
ncbi:MAG: hypothetical protein CM15mP120_08870 [Pseudomonadota bacterium]|nr:MAG: hypothetical protein CM15mP120_08870 [Pseudomonadota bacterium]